MKKDYGKYFGSMMMFGFGAIAFYRWHQTQLVFFLLLVLRDFVAAYFFLKRKPSSVKANNIQSLLAYISSAMPLLYFSPSEDVKLFYLISNLFSIVGFLLVALATIELGHSIGISPANRGHVSSGIYRLIKHPMYWGYVISEAGMVFLNPLNAVLLLISSSLYFTRARFEEKVLDDSNR